MQILLKVYMYYFNMVFNTFKFTHLNNESYANLS